MKWRVLILSLYLLLAAGCTTVKPSTHVEADCQGTVQGCDLDGDTYFSQSSIDANNTDCDDSNAEIYPGAVEVCNGGKDDDCDPDTNENGDEDSDGFTACIGDCDDSNARINPAAQEVCNGVDDDCDPATNEALDGDSDGYNICDGDCNDSAATVHPGATETCNGIDDDCDRATDEKGDEDKDGFSLCMGDCDDTDATTYLGATEVCNGVDDDCNGEIDENLTRTFYQDSDGDGYGNPSVTDSAGCSCPPGYVSDNTDCDDTILAVNPGATEVCEDGTGAQDNGIDDDCDSMVDECRLHGTISATDSASIYFASAFPGPNSYGLGFAVTGAGDTDDDGLDDILIGAPYNDLGTSKGGAFLVRLKKDAPYETPLTLEPQASGSLVTIINYYGESEFGYFGSLVAGAGDVNGDGKDDILLGSTDGGSNLFLAFGEYASDSTIDPDHSAYSYAFPAQFHGPSGLAIGGYFTDSSRTQPDIVIDDGNSSLQECTNGAGAAYIFPGPISLADDLSSPKVTLHGKQTCGLYYGLSFVGDVNGDGYDELLLGAASSTGNGALSVFLVYGGTTKLDITLDDGKPDEGYVSFIMGNGGPNRLGYSFGGEVINKYRWKDGHTLRECQIGLGQLQASGAKPVPAADQVPDFLIGSNNNEAFLIYGESMKGLDGMSIPIPGGLAQVATVQGENSGDLAGMSVACAGDFDGNGYDDILVGAYNWTDGSGRGAVYVLYAAPDGSGIVRNGQVASALSLRDADLIIRGASPDQYFGKSVAGAGDVNGDGYDDIVVGAPPIAAGKIGGVYLFFGGPRAPSP